MLASNLFNVRTDPLIMVSPVYKTAFCIPFGWEVKQKEGGKGIEKECKEEGKGRGQGKE